jgi:hypothetical protein
MIGVSTIYLHEDEDIDGVVVLAEGAGDEAVVVRVHHGRVQDPVNLTTRNTFRRTQTEERKLDSIQR